MLVSGSSPSRDRGGPQAEELCKPFRMRLLWGVCEKDPRSMNTKSEAPQGHGAENNAEIGGKETIVVVHGTFASPSDRGSTIVERQPAVAEWYRPGGSFCVQLDAHLAEIGSNARTWKHLREDHEQFFWWSGANSWQARLAAADRLATYLQRLVARGWCCHVIAHSHGGNVTIEAIRKLGWLEGFGVRALGSICLLGTPIYTLPSPGSRSRTALYVMSVIAPIAAVLLHDLTSAPSLIDIVAHAPSFLFWVFCGVVALILFLRLAAALVSHMEEVALGWGHLEFGIPMIGASSFFFAVNSRSDEAYQLLQVLNAKSPLDHISLRMQLIVKDAAILAGSSIGSFSEPRISYREARA
jgi:hypothetical protein